MYQKDEIVEQLGIQSWDADQQDEAAEIAIYRIGNAVTASLSDKQLDEYEEIVNDNHEVIDRWLEANAPEYKTSPVYQEFVDGYNDDPEKNNPAKLFASVAWIQANVPDVQERIDAALAAYKQELASA